jgi:hypothetical protein
MVELQQLQKELQDMKRDLATAQRALRDQRVAVGRPIGPEDTVRALGVVLQHTMPDALAKVQRDRERLAVELRHTQARLRTQKDWYTRVRYDVWRIAQAALQGVEWPTDALHDIVAAVDDSDDDADYEMRHAG